MADQSQSPPTRGMFIRRLILGIAFVFALLACVAVGVAYLTKPSLAVWTVVVTIAAISLEVLFWSAAGVFGWSFLAKRRATLQRWFGKRRNTDAGDAAS